MTAPTAGWYADPTGGPGLRYWDGAGWTDSTQQGAQQPGYPPNGQVPPSYGQPSYGQPSYGQPAFGQPTFGQPPFGQPAAQSGQPAYGQPPVPANQAAGLWAHNKTSFITVLICLIYLVIAGFSHFVFFGILPILYTVRAFQAKEPLAWVAALTSVVTIGFSIYQYTR